MTTDEMKQKIHELTGVVPASDDPKHLRARLADLRRHAPMTVSMSSAAKMAILGIADGADTTVSQLVREALAEWAAKRGMTALSKIINEQFE